MRIPIPAQTGVCKGIRIPGFVVNTALPQFSLDTLQQVTPAEIYRRKIPGKKAKYSGFNVLYFDSTFYTLFLI